MSSYYWLNAIALKEGSVVLPGTWARVKHFAVNDPWSLLEEVYEKVRVESFSSLPSRMNSVFVFEDKELAIRFKQTRPADLLYEVKVCDKTANHSTVDMKIVLPFIEGVRPYSVGELMNQASRYWASAAVEPVDRELPEVIIEGPIEIVKLL